MENEIKKLKNIIDEEVNLSLEEKSLMREKLLTFIDANPPIQQLVPSPLEMTHGFNFNVFLRVAMIGLVLFIGGGTAVSFAEKTLPGDLLYSFKVSVNEPLMKILTFNSKDDGLLNVNIVERRLKEAETLATNGNLTQESKESLQKQILAKIDDTHESIRKLESEDDTEGAVIVSTELESSLKAHEQILSAVALKSGGLAIDVSELANTVGAESVSAEAVRSNVEAKVFDETAEQNRLSASKTLLEVRGLVREVEAIIPMLSINSGKTEQYLNSQLGSARTLVASSTEDISRGDDLAAIFKLQEARSILKQVVVLADSSSKLPNTTVFSAPTPIQNTDVNTSTVNSSAILTAPPTSTSSSSVELPSSSQ